MEFLNDHQAWISLALVACVFVGFLTERFPPAVVAAAGAAAFLALGFLSTEEALAAFSNPAPITIAAMFILSGALIRTGALEAIATRLVALSDNRPRLAITGLFGGAMFASGFMNNTPVVIILVPLVTQLASKLGVSKKKLLIPLSYVCVLGGTLTLVGTSTNLLVDSIAREIGGIGFGIFDITIIGLVTAFVGVLTMIVMSRIALPGDAEDLSDEKNEEAPDILTELRVSEEAGIIGKPFSEASMLNPRGVQLIAVRRGGKEVDIKSEDTLIEARDRIIVRVTKAELLTLCENNDFLIGIRSRTVSDEDLIVAEISIAANNPAIGGALSKAGFVSQFAVEVIGASRHGHKAGPDLASMLIKPGDNIFVRATRQVMRQLQESRFLAYAGEPLERGFRRGRLAIAVGAIVAVVTLAALGVAPLAALAMIAAAGLLLLRCIDSDEAWRSIDGDVLVLIFTMLIMGAGLQNTGAIDLIVTSIAPWLESTTPLVTMLGIYLLTSILTEIVTNNAVAVIMTPIVISLAETLGIDARALVVTVMFAASASFATPIGYQTNTVVYAAGGYRFSEFLSIGVPMNIIVGLASVTAIFYLF